MSGIAISQEAIKAYEDFKMGGRKHAFVIFKINDDFSSVIVEHLGEKTDTFDKMVSLLPAKEPRFAVVDVPYTTDDGCDRTKIVFVNWSPDVAKMKPKMIYASTSRDFRRRLTGVGLDLQATDASEIELAAVLEKVKRI